MAPLAATLGRGLAAGLGPSLVLGHQTGPVGIVLVLIPLLFLSLVLRAARRRAQWRVDELAVGDEPPTGAPAARTRLADDTDGDTDAAGGPTTRSR